MKIQVLLIASLFCLLFASCEYDNYNEPTSILSGRVIYNGTPVGVRTNGTQLELWQNGFKLFTKIPVFIAHDGTFSASLFDGQYKLVRMTGAPWLPQTSDTIVVNVKGNTNIEVPVSPYFVIKNESFAVNAGSITVKFTVEKPVASAVLGNVNIYFGNSILTDNIRNEGVVNVNLANVTLGQETTVVATIPAKVASSDYMFVRIGAKATVSSEYCFTRVQKIALK